MVFYCSQPYFLHSFTNIWPNLVTDELNESSSHGQEEVLLLLEWLSKLMKLKNKNGRFLPWKQRNAYHRSNPWLEAQLCYKLYIWCSWTWTLCFLSRILSKIFFSVFWKKSCILQNSNNIWVSKKHKTALFLIQIIFVLVYDMWEVMCLCSGLTIQSQSKVIACYVFYLVHIDLLIHIMV